MFNRFLSQFTLAVLMALPLMAEPVSNEGTLSFKNLNVKESLFRNKLRFPRPRPKPPRKPCCKGPKGSKGSIGTAGATGPTGAGPLLDYASFVTTQTFIPSGSYIPFDITSVNQGSGINGTTTTPGVTIDATNTLFTVQVPGDYVINLGLDVFPDLIYDALNYPSIIIYQNGSPLPSTAKSNTSFIGTSIILANLSAGTTIQVQATTSLPLGFNVTGSQTGYLSFSRVGP